ncbi:hypothetical protein JTB14_024307 [Gonioctena quinquepunctata]|nr:hypothetical protein JTB14_024307 [Gonioctena quinquepunctata]
MYPSKPFIVSTTDNQLIIDTSEIAENSARYFESSTSPYTYTESFFISETPLNIKTISHLSYNDPSMITELTNVLNSSRKSISGPDNISYEFMQYLPYNKKSNPLHIINRIWPCHHGKARPRWRIESDRGPCGLGPAIVMSRVRGPEKPVNPLR